MDTNVLVSGLLTPFGVCGSIVRLLTSGNLTLCVDARILFEYEDVLRRPRFKIDHKMISVVMEYIEATAEVHNAAPLQHVLPDPDDHPFLEVAMAASANALITGNIKHFPVDTRHGVRVVTPREFLNLHDS